MNAANQNNVSTHSRLKAAGTSRAAKNITQSFNTQPPEGGCPQTGLPEQARWVSTHSRLKAADSDKDGKSDTDGFQHTAA